MLRPWMPQQEIAVMDAIFALKRPKRVLEYGAGGSTVRWSAFPSVEEWVTVEHDAEWLRKTAEEVDAKVQFHFADSPDPRAYVAWAPDSFVPWGSQGPFDLIFVDGIHRVACVKASTQFLAPHGVVIMHDVWQGDRLGAFGTYPHEAILGKPDRLHNGFLVMWGEP